jgi:hypothetical protein
MAGVQQPAVFLLSYDDASGLRIFTCALWVSATGCAADFNLHSAKQGIEVD